MRFYLAVIPVFFLLSSFAQAGENSDAPKTDADWSIHAQATVLPQTHGSFFAPYSGLNSLSSDSEFKTSFTTTGFFGRRLWAGGEAYFDPEISGGEGLSTTKGIAGFPNGEIYRVDTPSPKLNLARLYLKQVWGYGGEREKIEDDQNQLAATLDSNRFTLIGGKFSLNDFFDNNAYSHDPRTQFFNWALMDNGAWDYAADTRGYTIGIYLEYHRADWALRFASVLEPAEGNGMSFDSHILLAEGNNLEFEYHYPFLNHPGIARVLAYLNRAHMGNYRETIDTSSAQMNIENTASYCIKYGFGLNLQQEVTSDFGLFMRAGWNNGTTETWAFTEIDRTLSLGMNLKGSTWKRDQDTFGFALIVNGLSQDHRDYLAAGGYGFIIGDGKLNYAPEEILETYYSIFTTKFAAITLDYQFVNHPAYNSDRGPVSIYGVRFHVEI